MLKERISYVRRKEDLLCFCQYLALHRGIAAVPYPTGLVRFAIGGFLADTEESKQVFKYELEYDFG